MRGFEIRERRWKILVRNWRTKVRLWSDCYEKSRNKSTREKLWFPTSKQIMGYLLLKMHTGGSKILTLQPISAEEGTLNNKALATIKLSQNDDILVLVLGASEHSVCNEQFFDPKTFSSWREISYVARPMRRPSLELVDLVESCGSLFCDAQHPCHGNCPAIAKNPTLEYMTSALLPGCSRPIFSVPKPCR